MVERGVRFVQLWSGGTTGGGDWDGHAQCDRGLVGMAGKIDQPVAGLLADLKSRGLLDTTLVIWGGEFGRTPTSDGSLNGGGDSKEGLAGAGGADAEDEIDILIAQRLDVMDLARRAQREAAELRQVHWA